MPSVLLQEIPDSVRSVRMSSPHLAISVDVLGDTEEISSQDELDVRAMELSYRGE